MNRILTPFKGIDNNYLLYQSISETISRIEKDGETYVKEIWLNEDCDSQVPWTILRTSSGMSFFFANDKLFKIYVSTGFQGSLSNGIKIGMKMNDATKLDSSLKYDDWEEDWQSPDGYWLEDDPSNDTVLTITIFIRELLNDELFEKYNW